MKGWLRALLAFLAALLRRRKPPGKRVADHLDIENTDVREQDQE
jgi:hypothetical protein